MLDGHVEVHKQRTLEEDDEPESELKEKTRVLSKLTGLDLFKLASSCLSTLIQAKIDKQQIDKELRGCSPACYEETGKEKKNLSHQISLLDFYKSYSGTPASYLYFWTLETMF
jgi:hypothetical protein